jgi:hypothetical protein
MPDYSARGFDSRLSMVPIDMSSVVVTGQLCGSRESSLVHVIYLLNMPRRNGDPKEMKGDRRESSEQSEDVDELYCSREVSVLKYALKVRFGWQIWSLIILPKTYYPREAKYAYFPNVLG